MWYSRIRYDNRPDHWRAYGALQRDVDRFFEYDSELQLAFVVEFTGQKSELTNANIQVFLPDENMQVLNRIGTYKIGQLDAYKETVDRVFAGSTTGSVEDETNLLYNGLFNKGSDGLDGWEIESDAGNAVLSVDNGILQISDANANAGIVLLNNRTVLTNLQSYKATMKVDDISASANVKLKLGSQDGVTYTTKGMKNESIVAAGTEVRIHVVFTDVTQNVKIGFIILGAE